VFPFTSGINQHNSSFWFAAAHGLPIVATSSSSTEQIFVDKQNVIFAAPGDPSDLYAKINQLGSDQELRAMLGANAEILADEQYSWASCIERTLEVFTGGSAPSSI
jgi:glycosyltransferase involved in cell wall biosynthesis